jgi:nucleoid DNA-binding protein
MYIRGDTMSKLQLLYEKLMKMMYIFAGIFFVLFLIDLFIAISTNAFDCTSVTFCVVRESSIFIKVSLYPVAIATLVFIVAGRIFFGLAHKQSNLMSVSDYRRSVGTTDSVGQTISRDEISERFRTKNIKESDNILNKAGKQIQKFVGGMKSSNEARSKRKEEKRIAKDKLKLARKSELEQLQKIEENLKHEQDAKKARKKLNKTELILYVADVAKLSQNDSRKFINTFTDIIKETVVKGEEVKIAKFGKFSKETIEESKEINETTNEEVVVEACNTVGFTAFRAFLDTMNGVVDEVEEPVELEKSIENTVEKPDQAVKVEVAKEEQVEEPILESVEKPVIEDFDDLKSIPDATEDEDEDYLEELIEEPVEEVKEEPVEELIEELVKDVKEEPVEEVKKDLVKDVKEEPVEDVKEEKSVEPVVAKAISPQKPKKPKKPKVVSKTKTDFIQMMDAKTDLSKNKANKFLKYFAEVVKEQLVKGEDVDLEGIGYFTTIEMPAKEAVNPQTKQKIIVPSHHQVRLRFNDDLKGKMNPKK